MRMAIQQRVWTADEVRELIDEQRAWPRYEAVDGELLVTPAPRPPHQYTAQILLAHLAAYARRHGVGLALLPPADISFGAQSIVQPDLFVVPAAQARPLLEWSQVTSLELAVEVVSPSSARADRGAKRRHYQRHGVREYWVVDLDARLIERWRPNDERPEVLDRELSWQPNPAAAPLVIDLPSFFAEVTAPFA